MYDAIVIGAGHAGIESALALARMKKQTLLITLDRRGIGYMACNPSIGGTAKGHLVREIDALGGQMGLSADKALLQIKMLNLGKGAAVHSLRGQEDKELYHLIMEETLYKQEGLTVLEGEVDSLIVQNDKIKGIVANGKPIYADAVVLASGVYLDSKIFIGEHTKKEGPSGFDYSKNLTKSLVENGLDIRRFKTGTPARILKDSIDYSKMEIQEGDETIDTFSFMSEGKLYNQMPCYLTYTNLRTHEIIKQNIHRSPLFNGSIKGVGPRYCPSIEDKIMRFADKDRHQIFIEPEGRDSDEMYIQGMSSSLPKEVQEMIYHSVAGLERAKFLKYAYAIEYDCINPVQLLPTLKIKHLEGFYSAGQVNGSSGYEEAAAQGLIAGINAALYLSGKEPYVLTRDRAYTGVLIDDLVTKGTNEPYRMMTARAEHRLYLRQDNADIRLTEDGYKLGLATEERYQKLQRKTADIARFCEAASKIKIKNTDKLFEDKGIEKPAKSLSIKEALARPELTLNDVKGYIDDIDSYMSQAVATAEVEIKYAGYLVKQDNALKEQRRLEEKKMPEDIDYMSLSGLRIEARQKLAKIKPLTLAQASRISGVSPADISVLIIYLAKQAK
jgi:tRNA uridine 5-carboxymethylaminomethyl modification enzyme